MAILDATSTLHQRALSSEFLLNAQYVLQYTQTAAPIVLLLVFIGAFIASSIISAKRLTPNGTAAYGPGGRPLPKRTRSTMTVLRDRQEISPRYRLLFQWLAVAVLLSYVVDAAINICHAVIYRSEHWWRGQATVVSLLSHSSNQPPLN